MPSPKLKPIKDEAELAAIPISEPVLVELEPAATGVDTAPLKADDTLAGDGDGADRLSRDLQAAKDEAAREREARIAAERDAERLRASQSSNEKELLTGSLEKAQQEQAAAKEEFKRAYESGDPDAMVEAQAKIGRTAAQVLNLEGALAQFDEGGKPADPKAGDNVDVMTAIERAPNLMPKEREWLKAHPETWIDPAINQELAVGYRRAVAAGHKRGTEAYFKFLDEFMGFSDPDDGDGGSDSRSSIVSAPVTREARTTGGRQQSSRVMLTPRERDLARSMGLSDVEWARGKQELEANKRADPAKFASR